MCRGGGVGPKESVCFAGGSCRVQHWRAHLQAEGFEPCLSIAGWGHSSALSHVFSRPPLSSVRRVFPGTASSNRHLPVWSGVFRGNTGVKTDPAIPLGGSNVYSILRLHHVQGQFPPPLCAGCPPRRRHLCTEVLAPGGLCCPTLQRLATSSASLEASFSLTGAPVIETVFDIHRVILS